MSTDVWFAEQRGEEWTVYDENRLLVAFCGDRQDDAESIARDHNTHEHLLLALAACAEFLDGVCFAKNRAETTRGELARLAFQVIEKAKGVRQ